MSRRLVTMRTRVGPLHVSTRVDVRVAGLVALVAALVVAVAVWKLLLGDLPLGMREVLAGLAGRSGGLADFVVRGLRLPRLVAGVLVGAALGTSGAIFQGLVRNPLAAPDIIGVNAGASLAAVILIVVLRSTALLPLAAFAGAVAAAFAVYVLTWRGGISGHRLVLVGIGVNAVLGALVTLVVVRYPVEEVSPAVLWLTGTLFARGWEHIIGIAVGLTVLLPTALLLVPRLRLLQLGDDAARALGVRAEAARAGLLVAGAGLAGAAVAVAGPVAFVALVVPHVARMLAGPLTAGVLLLSGGLGALIVVAADLVAEHALSPLTLPVGVITAAVGAPWFVFLLYRTNRAL